MGMNVLAHWELSYEFPAQLHSMTVGSDPRPNPGETAWKPIGERISEVIKKATPVK